MDGLVQLAQVLEGELVATLRPHFPSEGDARKVAAAFVKNLDRRLATLSLEDVERICENWGTEKRLTH